ncbi:beta-hydroxyacyl-ACP dehydratase [Saccharothrix sp. 6-C]|uniref:3-hydroxyacyl-ACP dehydratase FabZ family protein n=1 Tax=Saccharothrix sp. 6-C TaxID=2781735 RepID=UPI001917655D|nr:3-hydroxyacyl-ACP dehydratase [Saccharothrix sp. 6-C]QQQ74605.1 beta-hydroxyacyl-ACP dehydratase [Saccharothrix sp. 6-C]
MTYPEILRLLPHRHPVLLVDRVLDVVPGESLTALKAVSANEPCYARTGPGDYPSTLLVESWCQAAVLLSSWGNPAPDRVVLFGAIADVEFHRPVVPGCVVHHSVRVLDRLADTTVFTGESTADGHLVMTVGRITTTTRTTTTLRP